MADRSLPEQRRMFPQELSRVSTKVRSLQQRAYRGAVRTARADLVAGLEPGVLSQVLSLTTAPGRWVAMAQGNFVKASPDGTENLFATFGAFDPVSGEQISLAEENYPDWRWFSPAGAGSALIVPIHVFGDFIIEAQDQVTFSFLIQDLATDPTTFEVHSARLTLMPW